MKLEIKDWIIETILETESSPEDFINSLLELYFKLNSEIFYCTYRLPKGQWQSEMIFDNILEAWDILLFHAEGREVVISNYPLNFINNFPPSHTKWPKIKIDSKSAASRFQNRSSILELLKAFFRYLKNSAFRWIRIKAS